MFPFFGSPFGMPMAGGGQQVVMTPYGPAIVHPSARGGVVMTNHGPMLMPPFMGQQVICKYCHNPMTTVVWDLHCMAESDANEHDYDCPRRQEFLRLKQEKEERMAAAKRERERESEKERERLRRLIDERCLVTPKADGRASATWKDHRRMLAEKSISALSKRRKEGRKVATYVEDPEVARCAEIARLVMASSPYPDIAFEKLITDRPTGQAIVLKGHFRSQAVAVKIYLKDHYFDREASMLGAVGTHRNVIALLQSFMSPKRAIVMPFAENGCMLDMLNDRAFNNVLTVQYARQVAEGLQHIHSVGIAHLDIKADNILITARNVAVITDFGLAARSTGDDEIVAGCGTLPFMAPEGLVGTGRSSDATKMDVYAFGMLMLQMLSGQMPYETLFRPGMEVDSWHEIIEREVLAGRTPQIDSRWDVSTVRTMRSCWIRESTARPSMSQVLAALR